LDTVLPLKFLEHEEDAEEGSEPEEAVDDVFGGENRAEYEVAHPLLYDCHVLQGRALQYVEVRVAEDDDEGGHDAQAVEYRKLLVVLVRDARRKYLRERPLEGACRYHLLERRLLYHSLPPLWLR
jgi:hypothetical protein